MIKTFNVIKYVFGPLEVNSYLVGDPDSNSAFCIDPGGEPDLIIEDLEDKKWELKGILLTHAHFDHVVGAGPLKEKTDAPLYLHKKDVEIYRRAPDSMMRWLGVTMDYLPEIDYYLEENKELYLGNKALVVLHTPGHTPGSVCFYGGGCIFTGDLIFKGSVGRTDFPGGSTKDLIKSIIEKILPLPENVEIFPGHGEMTDLKTEIENNPFVKEFLKY